MDKFILSVLLIIGGLTTGAFLKPVLNRHNSSLSANLGKWLQKTAVFYLIPLIALGAVWVARIEDYRLILLPGLGTFTVVSGGMAGLFFSRLLKHGPKQKGPMFLCGGFSNFGSFGGFISYMLWGEQSYAFVALTKLLDEVNLVTIGYPVAKYFAQGNPRINWEQIRKYLLDPVFIIPVTAVLSGLTLNLLKWERPPFFEGLNGFLIPATTFMLLVATGLNLKLASLRLYLRECIAVSLIKFLFLPAVVGTIAWILGLHRIDQGLPFKVLLVLTSMPVAFYSQIPPAIYDLDRDLAGSCWLFTTGLMFLLLPVIFMVLI